MKRPRWARDFSAPTKSSGWSRRAARGKAAPVGAAAMTGTSGAVGATNANVDNGANVGDDCRQLSRQDATTLGATGANHAATTFGSHAGAKAVGALTADNGGLKCTFHDCLARSLGICGCRVATAIGRPRVTQAVSGECAVNAARDFAEKP